MIGSIARNELRLQLRDGRGRAATLVMALLLAVSLTVGWRRHVDSARTIASAQATTQKQFVTQGRKNPHMGAHYGIYAYRPESPLAFFDPGVDEVTGIAIFVEPHEPHRFRDPPAEDQTSLSRFGSWSAAGLAEILIPLLVLLLAAPSIAREREQGTLRVLFAQGVRGVDLMLGKSLGVALTLGMALGPALAGLALVAILFPSTLPISAGRAGWLVAGYLLYLALFLFVALAISARARSTAASLVMAMGFWSVTVIVAPRAAAELSSSLSPAPSAFAIQNELLHATWANDISAWDEHSERFAKEQMKKYGVSREEDLPIHVSGLTLEAQEEEDAPEYDRVYGALFATFARQERTLDIASAVAPLLAVQSVSMAASGTDMSHRVDYWWSVEHYRREMVREVNDYITHAPVVDGVEVTGDRDLWATIPPFAYRQPEARWAVAQSVWAGVGLLGWALAAFALALLCSRRMPVSE